MGTQIRSRELSSLLLYKKNSLDKESGMEHMRFVMRVGNDKEGRNLIQSMRENLNSKSYRIVTRYTGKRPVGTSQYSTSKENATSIRVYVESKLPSKREQWLNEQTTIIHQKNEVINHLKTHARGKQEVEEELRRVKSELKEKTLIDHEKKVLEAKLLLLTERLKNSSKYGSFVRTVNSINTVK